MFNTQLGDVLHSWEMFYTQLGDFYTQLGDVLHTAGRCGRESPVPSTHNRSHNWIHVHTSQSDDQMHRRPHPQQTMILRCTLDTPACILSHTTQVCCQFPAIPHRSVANSLPYHTGLLPIPSHTTQICCQFPAIPHRSVVSSLPYHTGLLPEPLCRTAPTRAPPAVLSPSHRSQEAVWPQGGEVVEKLCIQ